MPLLLRSLVQTGKINQDNRYRALVEMLIRLKPNDWSKFQEPLKNLHTVEFELPEEQTQQPLKEKHKLNLPFKPEPTLLKKKKKKEITQNTSPICPLTAKLDNLGPNNKSKAKYSPQSKTDYTPII